MEIETDFGFTPSRTDIGGTSVPRGGVREFRPIVTLEKEALAQLLPHEGEALVIDSVDIDEVNREATGHLFVGGSNQQVFRGHFGLMAGHWMFEFANLTCAALALYLLSLSEDAKEKKVAVFLTGADGISTHRKVVSGDNLFCNVAFIRQEGRQVFFSATIFNSITRKKVCSIREISGMAA